MLTNVALSVFAIGIYILVCMFLVSGGWQKLRANYPAIAKPEGQQWRFASARIGRTFYQALRVVDAEKGLYLSCPIALFHSPVLIPWTAMTRDEETQSRFHFGELRLSVTTSRGAVILIFQGVVAKAIEHRVQIV